MPQLKLIGATLIALCPQRPEFLRQMREKHKLLFDILRDEGNEIAAQFGLRHTLPDYLREVYLQFPLDLSRVNGEDSWTLAMPSRYVIGQNGVISYAEYDPDYTRRPEPAMMLETLQKLK